MDTTAVQTRSEKFPPSHDTPEFRRGSIPSPAADIQPVLALPTLDTWLAAQALLLHLLPTAEPLPFLLTNKQGSQCELKGMPRFRININSMTVVDKEQEERRREKREEEEEREEPILNMQDDMDNNQSE